MNGRAGCSKAKIVVVSLPPVVQSISVSPPILIKIMVIAPSLRRTVQRARGQKCESESRDGSTLRRNTRLFSAIDQRANHHLSFPPTTPLASLQDLASKHGWIRDTGTDGRLVHDRCIRLDRNSQRSLPTRVSPILLPFSLLRHVTDLVMVQISWHLETLLDHH